ncbi:MAG: hypothetical protein QW109_05480 [Sulfolobales archaeon]
MSSTLPNTSSFLFLLLLSLPIVFLLIAVLLAPEAPRTILRTVVGVLAALGCYEVLLYSAGYTSRLEHVIPTRLSIKRPSLSSLLEYVSLFMLASSIFKLLESSLYTSYPVVIALSLVATYFTRRLLKSVLTTLKQKSFVAFVVSAVFVTQVSDYDIGYLQTLLRFLEEVVRNAL